MRMIHLFPSVQKLCAAYAKFEHMQVRVELQDVTAQLVNLVNKDLVVFPDQMAILVTLVHQVNQVSSKIHNSYPLIKIS